IVQPATEMPTRTALKMALVSAWQMRASFFSLSLRRLASSCTPRGRPLYPVASTRLSGDTITAPTRHLGSFDFRATVMAISRKYSSHSPIWWHGSDPSRIRGAEGLPLVAMSSHDGAKVGPTDHFLIFQTFGGRASQSCRARSTVARKAPYSVRAGLARFTRPSAGMLDSYVSR